MLQIHVDFTVSWPLAVVSFFFLCTLFSLTWWWGFHEGIETPIDDTDER